MGSHPETPFDTVENAHEYVRLLLQAITDARQDIAADIATASGEKSDRRLEALRLVHYKLEKLEQHLHSSSRMLNDLRSLRRLLFAEKPSPRPSTPKTIRKLPDLRPYFLGKLLLELRQLR